MGLKLTEPRQAELTEPRQAESLPESGYANRTFALIMGVYDYNSGPFAPLPGVKKDVEAINSSFKDQGMDTHVELNPTAKQLLDVLARTTTTLNPKVYDQLIIYFAGHGRWIEQYFGKRLSLLIPSGAPHLDDPGELREFLVPTNLLLAYADAAPIRKVLLLFDTCYADDLGARFFRPQTAWGPVDSPCRLIITSGSPGEAAFDDSIFCKQLLKGLYGHADADNDGLILASQLADYVYRTVSSKSNFRQHPQFASFSAHGSDSGDFVFRVPAAHKSTPAPQMHFVRDEILKAVQNQLPKELQGMLDRHVNDLIRRALGEYLHQRKTER